MSFPMLEAFSRDSRRGITEVVVYEFLWRELDDKSPMECALDWISHAIVLRGERRLDRGEVSRALKNLVDWGYFDDHRTDQRKPRALTLVRVPKARRAA